MEIETHQGPEPKVRRLWAGAFALVLLGGIGGFVVGRAGSGAAHPTVVAGALPTGTAATPGSEATMVTDAPVATAAPAAEVPPGPAAGTGSMDVATPIGGAPSGAGAWAEAPQELLGAWVRPDGVTIRVHVARYGADMVPVPMQDGWVPAAWCYASGDLRVSVSTPTSINIAWAPFFSEPRDGAVVTTFATGYVEGSPMFGAVVQVGPTVESVTFTGADGSSDVATPIGGIAALLLSGPIQDGFVVELRGSDGTVIKRTSAELAQQSYDDAYRTACDPPPPALPPAGEQPADPDAARVAVADAWHMAHDGSPDATVRASFVDDPTGLVEAWDALQAGQYADAAKSAVVDIDELVFTSPTEAWFRYDIETVITNFTNRYGVARLGDDGVWRITRQTICQDIALAPGFGCTPQVDTVVPPSAVGDPQWDPNVGPVPEVTVLAE